MRTRATTRSRTSSPTCRCALPATSCSRMATERGSGLYVPRSLRDLVAAPLLGDLQVRREPHVAVPLDVGDQLVEHRDPRMASDAKRVDHEQKAAADPIGAVELRLPDLEHLA